MDAREWRRYQEKLRHRVLVIFDGYHEPRDSNCFAIEFLDFIGNDAGLVIELPQQRPIYHSFAVIRDADRPSSPRGSFGLKMIPTLARARTQKRK